MDTEKYLIPAGSSSNHALLKPRLVIHGGAGNIRPENYPPEVYKEYRDSLLDILCKTNAYMTGGGRDKSGGGADEDGPCALDIATHAVAQLEDNPLFNSGRGAVFTRDGVNELEASVMVSRGSAKRAAGVMGLRRVRNPILLAKRILEHGDEDLSPALSTSSADRDALSSEGGDLDVPSAQGHTQLWGPTAEKLARDVYGLDMVEEGYFFTQKRWDEHVRALERERRGEGLCSWSADEYLPQGTCGAVAMDGDGVICVATSTGGMTNKLTGRVGDTPVPGAGFWAEEWEEEDDQEAEGRGATAAGWGDMMRNMLSSVTAGTPLVSLAGPLRGFVADCLPTPHLYTPAVSAARDRDVKVTRAMGASGTGNGDSFLRISAVRTVAARARFTPERLGLALRKVTGPGGDLQRSAGDRWSRTGEGQGGMIGIGNVIVRRADGSVVNARSEVIMDFNCSGMFRAWIDEDGKPHTGVWRSEDSVGDEEW